MSTPEKPLNFLIHQTIFIIYISYEYVDFVVNWLDIVKINFDGLF